jgi:predicted acylesterase/phospholipase RssA
MQFNLVFEGGGAKGIVFVGAMQEFEARGHTFGRVLGTSAGAITATFLAAGYSTAEMLEATAEKLPDNTPRFSSFLDIPEQFKMSDVEDSLSLAIFRQIDIPFVPEVVEKRIDIQLVEWSLDLTAYRQVFSFVELGGLYSGEKFLTWMTEKLNAGGRNLGDATLAEFAAKTGKDLTVVASDTTGEQILVLNHRTAPDCPVVYAVRMSMSVPFLWQEVRWKSSWGLYNGKDISGHAVVDGGVLSNFPIELLISRSKEVIELMGPHDGHFALGFLIDEDLPVPGAGDEDIGKENGKDKERARKRARKPAGIDLKQIALVRRVSGLINTVTRSRDKQVINAYSDGVCRLPAKGYGTTEFDMSDARMDALVNAGRQSASAFFDTFTLP